MASSSNSAMYARTVLRTQAMMLPTTLLQGGAIGFASAPPGSIFEDAAALEPTFLNSVRRSGAPVEAISSSAWLEGLGGL